MHEMPIATDIVERAVEAAEQHGATRIEQIEVHIGLMRQVVPEALELAFTLASEGTMAHGAKLSISQVKAVASCNVCGCRFEPEVEISFACPRCSQADVRIVAGNDIILTSVTCQADEEASLS